ncbi:nitrate transporter, partial [Hansschlegelia beijingensis]
TGPGGAEREEPDYLVFARGGAMRPDLRHARWLYGEMTRWGQAPEGQVSDAEAVYRPDLYDAAMGASAAPEVSDPLGLFTG